MASYRKHLARCKDLLEQIPIDFESLADDAGMNLQKSIEGRRARLRNMIELNAPEEILAGLRTWLENSLSDLPRAMHQTHIEDLFRIISQGYPARGFKAADGVKFVQHILTALRDRFFLVDSPEFRIAVQQTIHMEAIELCIDEEFGRERRREDAETIDKIRAALGKYLDAEAKKSA